MSPKKIISTCIDDYFAVNPIRLGGPDIIVQINETKLNYNVKNHRGRHTMACWAICIVDTSFKPSLGYTTIVTDRSANSIISVINEVVIPGSIIHTDEWKAYSSLNKSDIYTHQTVCHKYNFVDPHTGVHTQNVESYNNRLKLKIKQMKGLTLDQRKVFLKDFMYRELNVQDKFEAFIKLFNFFLRGAKRT
jgi:transposase-like protein